MTRVVAVMGERGSRRLRAGGGQTGSPLGVGYVRLTSGSRESAGLVAEGIAMMEAFTGRCFYGLGDVFVDDDPSLRLGWASLVAAVRVGRPVAVLVPDLDGLRLPGTELDALRTRLRHVTSAPLVVARPEVAWAAPPDVDALVRPPLGSAVGTGVVTARRARSRRVGWRVSWGR